MESSGSESLDDTIQVLHDSGSELDNSDSDYVFSDDEKYSSCESSDYDDLMTTSTTQTPPTSLRGITQGLAADGLQRATPLVQLTPSVGNRLTGHHFIEQLPSTSAGGRHHVQRDCKVCSTIDQKKREKENSTRPLTRKKTQYYCPDCSVFQRRMDGTVDFYQDWKDYARGFGYKSGEFWLSLEAVHQLTQNGAYEFRIDLTDWDGSTAYAKYGTFSISGRSDNYRLTVGDYSGTAGNSLAYHNNRPFSAKNKDLDDWGDGNCATTRQAAWWFVACGPANLNGRYNDTSGNDRGVFWYDWKKSWRYSLKASEMKFRKK